MILQVREPLLEPVEPLLPEATEQVEKKWQFSISIQTMCSFELNR